MTPNPDKEVQKLDRWMGGPESGARGGLPAAIVRPQHSPPPPPTQKTALDPPRPAVKIAAVQKPAVARAAAHAGRAHQGPVAVYGSRPCGASIALRLRLGLAGGTSTVAAADRWLPSLLPVATYEQRWAILTDPKTGEKKQMRDLHFPKFLGNWKKGNFLFTDTCQKSDYRLLRRKLESPTRNDLFSGICEEGPMSEGGKPHGHWT